MIKLKETAGKEKNKTSKKEDKKTLPVILIVVAGLFLIGFLGYKFVFSKTRTKISNYFLSKSLSDKLGGDVKIEGDGEKVSYKDDDLEFSYDMGGDLPEGFPSDFPIYTNAKLISKYSSTQEESEGMSVMWETSDDLEKIVEYYKSESEKTGWEITSTFSSEDSSVLSLKKGDSEAVLGIAEAEDKVDISVTINSN